MARSFYSFTFALAITTLITFGFSPAPASAQPAVSSTAAVAEALEPFLNPPHNVDAASDNIDKLQRSYPDLPSGRVYMFQILASPSINQANLARLQLELAARQTPSDPEPYYLLGIIAIQDRRLAEASMDLDKAKQLLVSYRNPARKPMLEQQTNSGLELLAENRQEWAVAEKLLRELLDKAPDDLAAHQRLSRVLFWQGKVQDAYDVLKEGKKIDSTKNKGKETFPTPERVIARYYYEYEGPTSPTGKAEEWFKAAIANDKENLATRNDAAAWALETGKLDFAKEQADAALRIEAADKARAPGQQKYPPNSYVGRMLTGIVALWKKDWKTAQTNFENIIYVSPSDFMARNNLALALVEQDGGGSDQEKQDNLRRALEFAEANYRDNSKNAETLSTLGWVHYKRGELVPALTALQQSINLTNGTMSADTATYMAHVLYYSDHKMEAKELLDKVLGANRPFAMQQEARALYEKVKDLKPADSTRPTVGSNVP